MAEKPPVDDSVEGWGKARLFRDYCHPEKAGQHVPSLKEAIILASQNPDKYAAWKAKMRILHGDKFSNVRLFEVL